MRSSRTYTPGRSRFGSTNPTIAAVRLDGGSKVRVVVRVRPFLLSEIETVHGTPQSCLSIVDESNDGKENTLQICDQQTNRQESYKVDHCYGQHVDIRLIFEKEVQPMLAHLFRGYNVTVFAYGATGSGKTYTMQGLEDRPGLMPLALTNLLSMAANTKSSLEVSYYEVYMDRCYDLLQAKATEVSVLEDGNGRIQLRGLSQVQVKTLEEFREVLLSGCLQRRVGKTGLNDTSSRSHGVLTVTITTDEGNPKFPVVGRLNLIDLAGNEDNRRTGSEGIRLAESARINQSLFALSNVINALNGNETRVPYRDSKLTRILQDSLGGMSRALMIACLSPKSYQEAAHTLSLATRSRQIAIVPTPHDKMVNLEEEVNMAAKLQAWREAKGKPSPTIPLRSKALLTPSKGNSLFCSPLGVQRNLKTSTPRATAKARRVLLEQCQHSSFKQNVPGSCMDQSTSTASATTEIEKNSVSTEDTQKKAATEIEKNSVSTEDTQKKIDPNGKLHPSGSGVEADKENSSQALLPFTPSEKFINRPSSPPLSERLHSLRRAMEEFLQPLPGNADVECPSPQTTKSDFSHSLSPDEVTIPMSFCPEGNMPTSGTPLEKFSRNSSGIKNSLMKEYLNFLNKASREELLELKGIGEKRAACLLGLRQTSLEPLKELHDLKKIGLSEKQANFIFKNTARQIFS